MYEAMRRAIGNQEVVEYLPLISESFFAPKPTLLTSRVPIGKSLLVPLSLAEQVSDELVYVVSPTRFSTVAQYASIINLIGSRPEISISSGLKDPEITSETKLVYITAGRFIAEGLIKTARNVIVDDIHHPGTDMTLTKAVLKYRLTKGDLVRILLMTSMNLDDEFAFWKDTGEEIDVAV